MTELCAADQGVDQGGCVCPDLGENLREGGSGGHAVLVGDVGDDTAHWEVWGRFHHRVALRLMGKQPQRGRDGGWVYPPLSEAMAEAGL